VNNWETLQMWGYYPAHGVRDGALWSLVTSSFVHIAVWHFLFNLYWLYHLGTRLEKVIGSLRWIAFFVLASFVSSAYQLGISGDTGHGASGVAYAMFGFMWLTRKRFPIFTEVLDRQTIAIFFLWLVGCIVATAVGAAQIANTAHVTGMLFGIGCGALVIWKAQSRLIMSALAIFTLSSLLVIFWAPWSAEWISWRARRTHVKEHALKRVGATRLAICQGFGFPWVGAGPER